MVAGIIDAFRAEAGIVPCEIADEEIVARTLYTMINEAALILEEGIAQRASDIDVVWVSGYGWPRATGGPMFWADTIGAASVVAGLDAYRDRIGGTVRRSASLHEMAAKGGRLTG